MRNMSRNDKKRKRQRGSVIVEAALVLPILLFILMGIVEFGRILMIQQTLTNAAREAARTAAIYLDNNTALSAAQTVAEDYLTNSGVDLNLITVDPVFSEVNGTDAVQVNVNYDYTSSLASWIPGMADSFELRSRVIMRREA